MVVPELGNLTVGGLEQILIVEIDKGVVPVGGIGTAYEQCRSTHRHYVASFAHIEETTREETGSPVDAVKIPFRNEIRRYVPVPQELICAFQ